ncbi:hypothetical protein BC829DRAFT_393242 [Chytridium lagenaria]|nr:hypothetical protein BC829DRAFT_393242 [Chytridium lagenaria]
MVRFKNRYLLFEVTYANGLIHETLHAGNFANAIRDSVELNFGDIGLGSIAGSFVVKYFSPYTGVGIVRVARDHVKMVWAAMTFKCRISVVHVGGMFEWVNCEYL